MPLPRLFVPAALSEGQSLLLPDEAARHVQVLRLQPGMPVVVFNGQGGEHAAAVLQIGRREVHVEVGAHQSVERELPCAVTLALGMPANDRMDTLVEKATELGVAAIQPLVCERSVLRLAGDRANRRREHWQGIAVAACEQSGRTRVPHVEPVRRLPEWLAGLHHGDERWMLSLAAGARPLHAISADLPGRDLKVLSGPEGGLTLDEEQAALAADFRPVDLGPRVLRADTAPLAVLAFVGLLQLRR